MNRRLAIAAAGLSAAGALMAIPALAQSSADERVRPGYWEYTTRIAGIPVDTEKKCVKPNEIDKVFFAGPCNRHHRCDYPVREVKDGKMRFDGTWTDKRGRVAKVKASGDYTPTTFKLNARGTTTTGIPMAVTMDAKWKGATCPAGVK